jgi:GntR family transcriptional regulator/MocR family aminotransferase
MRQGILKSGDKMPSLRQCEKTLGVSRTSIETAYLQLAADGYIYSVEKVGYFISEIAPSLNLSDSSNTSHKSTKTKQTYEYDLATIGEDRQVSCLDLWRRYMKSALRQEDRLLDYAASQGEEDLREEIAAYVRKSRNIICSKEDVVIGAGFQNLLQILIALIPGEKTISFPTKDFADGATTFKNAGVKVNYRDKESHVLYVTPSYMTKWGQIMDMKRRHEIVDHALNNNHLLIEDDYQNEFVFSSKPTPSLYAMTGGENVAFLGSFSRVLLPSVRISYIILPKGVGQEYQAIKKYYNQTSSKAEQIALAQFLRDGHLNRHIKKMRKLYEEKRQLMYQELRAVGIKDAEILFGESGMEIGLRLSRDHLKEKIASGPVAVNMMEDKDKSLLLLLSCSKIPKEHIKFAIEKLNSCLQN